MQISRLVQGDISGLRSGKRTAIQAKAKPKKYAPPSPRNIFPYGQFMMKNPPTAEAIRRQVNARAISSTCLEINPNAASIISITPAVSPLNPSIILIALATPPTAKAVNNTDIRVNPNNQSMPGIPTWVSAIPVIPQPNIPEAMVASRRARTETRLVRSSSRPKIKAGMPASKIALRMARFSAAAGSWLEAAKPTRTPTAMAMPPMRGVGWV